ncbi:unnamed protein product, partial [marine sediment metagenome]
SSQIEAFKIFIRRLGESIEKRVNEVPRETGSLSSDKSESIKKSLNNILTSFINVNKVSMEKFWNINSYEKIKEIISILFDKSTDNLTIIVPNIKTFIPLEKLELDYSEDLSLEKKAITKKTIPKKSERKGLSITKKQKKEIQDKLAFTAKKVAEERYHGLFNSFPYFIGLMDIEGTIIDCNPAVNNFLSRHTREDIIGLNFIRIFSILEENKKLIPQFERLLKETISDGSFKKFEFKLHRSKGGFLWLRIEGSPVQIG